MPEIGPICWIRWRWLWTLRRTGAAGICPPDAFVLEGASDLSELFDLPLAMVELENGVGG